MLRGIGIDLVFISNVEEWLKKQDKRFLRHIFSQEEINDSKKRVCPGEYLAGRLAVKEAVFKAIAHLAPDVTIDPRNIASYDSEDGCPHVRMNNTIKTFLKVADITEIQISVTTEGNQAIAFAVCF